jgi:rhamnogalacturonan endolyase
MASRRFAPFAVEVAGVLAMRATSSFALLLACAIAPASCGQASPEAPGAGSPSDASSASSSASRDAGGEVAPSVDAAPSGPSDASAADGSIADAARPSPTADAFTATDAPGAPDSGAALADGAAGSPPGNVDATSPPGFGSCQVGAEIARDDFTQGLGAWVPELQSPATSQVRIVSGKLDIDTSAGATVWFSTELNADLVIAYDVTVVVAGGPNDHLTDVNSFWMASDPANSNLFTRNGTFAQYDTLLLYYAGFGGNGNTTTRFRRYDATANARPDPIQAYTDAAHLLVANRTYHVQHVVCGGDIQYIVDGSTFFEYNDPSPYRSGRFAFRTTGSHESIGHFVVNALVAR